MVKNHYGMTFSSAEEMQAWEAYVQKQLETARQSPLVSREEADAQIKALLEKLENVSHSVA